MLKLVTRFGACLLFSTLATRAFAQDAPAQGYKEPLLRLQAGGPTSNVTALAFSPDGRTLYAGGWDKVVHVWEYQDKDKTWKAGLAYRVPLGPGDDGSINAMTLSADGRWLAVGGVGVIRNRALFDERGLVVPSLLLDSAMRRDQGTIFVFDTKTRAAKALRGHTGPVWALTFAPPAKDAKANEPPPLVSAARHFDDKTNTKSGAVYLWDVAKGQPRVLSNDLNDEIHPGLVAWRQPPGQALHVASPRFDKTLVVWKDIEALGVAAGMTLLKDQRFNSTALALPDRKLLLTGGSHDSRQYLQAWETPSLKPIAKLPAAKQAIPDHPYVQLALAAVSSQPGKDSDHVAAVVMGISEQVVPKHSLHLLDLASQPIGNLKLDLDLWKAGGQFPVIASSADGRFLAVAGNNEHEVWVFEVADLFGQKEKAQPWKLASVGSDKRQALFVKNKTGAGLLLRELSKMKPGAVPAQGVGANEAVFDFSRPGLTTTKDWEMDLAKLGKWTATLREPPDGKPGAQSFTVGDGKKSWSWSLPTGERVTDYALLSPAAPLNVPILAVASLTVSGEPSLALYHAVTGKLMRVLTGHDGVVDSVAFSGDGRLLASAASDQTVCVWSLTDLGTLLGKHGIIDGLAVKDVPMGKGTMVGRVAADSPAAGKLAEGDVLEALIPPGGKEFALENARHFFLAVWDFKPGDVLRLKVRGKGLLDVAVGQAVDERQPLVTLFVAKGGKLEQREWLAWHPQGPYVSSSEKAERLLGWHVNTGDAADPVRFAAAAKYRDKYLKPNILKELIAKGDLAATREEKPILPDPRVFVQIGDEPLDPTRADRAGRIRLQPSDRQLRVTVLDHPSDQITGVFWQGDDGEVRALKRSGGREWIAEIPDGWRTGEHELALLLRTPQGRLPEFVHDFKILLQSPPPTLRSSLPSRQEVMKPAFVVEAEVEPGLAEQEVNLKLFHNEKQVTIKAERDGAKLRFKKPLELTRGVNQFRVEAVNKDALKGFESAESARLTLEVVFQPLTPQIVLEETRLADKLYLPLPIKPGEPVIVDLPSLRLVGRITSNDPLTQATRNGKALDKFTAGGMKATIDEEITLKPGANAIVVEAATANAKETRTLEIQYQPRLPSVAHEQDARGHVYYEEGKGPQPVELAYRLKSAKGPLVLDSLQITARVNGKEVKGDYPVDATGSFKVRFIPAERDSRVEVQVTNPWRPEPENAEPVVVQYLRVPRGLAFVDTPAKSMTPVVNLQARVQSPLPLLPDSVRAAVNGKPINQVELKQIKGDDWQVTLKDVSLDDTRGSQNAIELQVGNADGLARVGAKAAVVFVGIPPKRPDVAILVPKRATDREIEVELRIRSDEPFTRLVLERDDDKTSQVLEVAGLPVKDEIKVKLTLTGNDQPLASIPLAKLNRNAEGYLAGVSQLRLKPGINRLRLTAANEGGETTASAVVDYFHLPIRIVLDRLETEEGKAQVLQQESEGRLAPPAAGGKVWVVGRVIWDDARDERLKSAQKIRARVNSYLQEKDGELAAPKPDRPRERAFRIPISLTAREDNRLLLELPGLPLDEASRRDFRLDCASPEPDRRFLHLVLIGIGENDREKFRADVIGKMQGKIATTTEIEMPGYAKGRLYGPLTDHLDRVTPDQVLFQFLQIKKYIGYFGKEGLRNHLIVVYWKGGEVLNEKGHFLMTTGEALMNSANLEDALADLRAAPILLLDVYRDPRPTDDAIRKDRLVNGPADVPLAVMRAAQLTGPTINPKLGLLVAWEEALSSGPSQRLRDLERQFGEHYTTLLRKHQGEVQYYQTIPASFADLVIGSQRK